jgi:cysteinyl-tRNA synthetase
MATDQSQQMADAVVAQVENALLDDLNTPLAFSLIADTAKKLRSAITQASSDHIVLFRRALVESGKLLGFLQADPGTWFEGGADAALKAKVEGLLKARIEARQAKDWTVADRIRDELNALNVIVMDNAEGATWRLREVDPT